MTYKPPFPDEIPGLCSFLYEANRFREPHEYIGYWKTKDQLEKKAKELSVNLGDMMSILFKLEELSREVRTTEDMNNELYDEKEEVREERDQLVDRVDKAETMVQDTAKESAIRESQRIEALFLLFQFGDHKQSCGYLEVLESGRALKVDEKEECTCGWIDLRDKIVQNPENIQLLKEQTNTENPLNGKPLNELRELDVE